MVLFKSSKNFRGETTPDCAAKADSLTRKAELSGAFQHGCELPLRDRTSELLLTMRSLNQLVRDANRSIGLRKLVSMFDIRPMLVNGHAGCPLCHFPNLDRSKIPLVDADIYAVSRACPLVVDVAEQL